MSSLDKFGRWTNESVIYPGAPGPGFIVDKEEDDSSAYIVPCDKSIRNVGAPVDGTDAVTLNHVTKRVLGKNINGDYDAGGFIITHTEEPEQELDLVNFKYVHSLFPVLSSDKISYSMHGSRLGGLAGPIQDEDLVRLSYLKETLRQLIMPTNEYEKSITSRP